MTWPQIIIAVWLALGPLSDLVLHEGKNKAWWIGRMTGHFIGINIMAWTLHWGGFW